MLGYIQQGLGPRHVIVMHDWLGDHRNYEPMANYWDAEHNTYTFVDLRGYGLSREMEGEYTSFEAANDVLEVMDSLGWDKAHLIGHSMSGMVAQRMFMLAPERVESMQLICAVPASGMKMPPEILDGVLSQMDDMDFRQGMVNSMWGERLDHVWFQFKMERWQEAVTVDAIKGYFRMFASEDFAADVKALKSPPVHVIMTDHDMEGFQENQMCEAFGELFPDALFSLCENSSHYPMQETPAYLATLLNRWLEQPGAASEK